MTAIKELRSFLEKLHQNYDKQQNFGYGEIIEEVEVKLIELAKKDLEDDTYKCSDGTFLTWLLGLKVYDDLEEVIK